MFIHIRDFLKNFFKIYRKLSRPSSHFTPRIQRTTCVIYISNHLLTPLVWKTRALRLQRASKTEDFEPLQSAKWHFTY